MQRRKPISKRPKAPRKKAVLYADSLWSQIVRRRSETCVSPAWEPWAHRGEYVPCGRPVTDAAHGIDRGAGPSPPGAKGGSEMKQEAYVLEVLRAARKVWEPQDGAAVSVTNEDARLTLSDWCAAYPDRRFRVSLYAAVQRGPQVAR